MAYFEFKSKLFDNLTWSWNWILLFVSSSLSLPPPWLQDSCHAESDSMTPAADAECFTLPQRAPPCPSSHFSPLLLLLGSPENRTTCSAQVGLVVMGMHDWQSEEKHWRKRLIREKTAESEQERREAEKELRQLKTSKVSSTLLSISEARKSIGNEVRV